MQGEKNKVVNYFGRLKVLIVINIIVFVAIGIAGAAQPAAGQILFAYLALPSNLHVLLTRLWTPLTYMFVYTGLLPLIFGMLWFYWVGQVFEDFLGGKKLLYLYLMGGLAGAVFFLLGTNLFPIFAASKMYISAIGAPACVMAVLVGTATLVPGYSVTLMFIGTVRLKWVIIAYVALELAFSGGQVFTLLGGAFVGFMYVRQLQNGNDWVDRVSGLFKPRSKLRVASKNSSKITNAKPRQDEIDRILDKISQTGYDSLNKQEKETLFRASSDDKN